MNRNQRERAKRKRMAKYFETATAQFGLERASELLLYVKREVAPHTNHGVTTMFPLFMQIEKEFPGGSERVWADSVHNVTLSDGRLDHYNALIGVIRRHRALNN